LIALVPATSLLFLALLGALAAVVGGAGVMGGVTCHILGALAVAAGVGALFGTIVRGVLHQLVESCEQNFHLAAIHCINRIRYLRV
jgi:hypothetical protein